jgi:hypothetical protein
MIIKKGIKTESRNQYTSYALSKLSIIFFSTLAVKQNEHTHVIVKGILYIANIGDCCKTLFPL